MKKQTIFTTLLLAGILALGASAAEPVSECYAPERTATIDGVISEGEWDGATRLTLNISDTSTWSTGGAGIVGTTGYQALGHTDDDFSTDLAFMCDEQYVYILMTRKDSTLNFATDNYHTPYASDCGLMWFYDTEYSVQYGLQLLAGNKAGTPIIGYFFMDSDQSTSENLMDNGTAKAVTTVTGDTYIMEAKVELSAMDDFETVYKNGQIKVTWCAVNICEEGWDSDDGEHALWGTYNYQAQYIGVNDWELAPTLKFGEDANASTETVATTALAEEAAAEEPVVEEPAVEEVVEVIEEPVVEEIVEPIVTEEPEVVEETPVEEPVVTVAPQTFDIGIVAAVSAVLSAAGYALTKKK